MLMRPLLQINQGQLIQKHELPKANQTSTLEELDPPKKAKGKNFVTGPRLWACRPLDELTSGTSVSLEKQPIPQSDKSGILFGTVYKAFFNPPSIEKCLFV